MKQINALKTLIDKSEKLVIGLMSGTSADGIDAALVRIQGSALNSSFLPWRLCPILLQ